MIAIWWAAFFMEHLNTDAGQVISSEDDWSEAYDSLFREGRQYRAFLIASRKMQEEQQILGSAIGLGPLFQARERSVAYDSLHRLKMAWLRRRFPDDISTHITNLITDAAGLKEASGGNVSTPLSISIPKQSRRRTRQAVSLSTASWMRSVFGVSSLIGN